jgi:hypothetical protein
MIKRSAQSVEICLVVVVAIIIVIIVMVANTNMWPNIPLQKSELLIFIQEVLLENFSLEISNSDGGILWFSSRPAGKL